MIEGTCLCGAVRYEIDGPLNMMVNCHCSMCRRHHGAPFATFAATPLEGFRWISGEDSITEYRSSAKGKRFSCKHCGSVTPTLAPQMGLAIVPVGNLLSDFDERPELHMFVGSKAPWYTITDDLPQHESWPPMFSGAAEVDSPVSESKPGVVTGSCLCGDVAYEADGEPSRMWFCHCSRCRRARSALHGSNVFWTPEQFRWIRGESQIRTFKAPDARHFTVAFCQRCGSDVPFIAGERGIVIVPAGTLDGDPGVRPAAHIFVDSKAPCFEITDQTPQHSGWPPRPGG